jgi:hypothetical protein
LTRASRDVRAAAQGLVHQVKSPREGVIVNEILEDSSGALQLRFYAHLGLVGFTRRNKEHTAKRPMKRLEDLGFTVEVRPATAGVST